jgi:hypothetical protein
MTVTNCQAPDNFRPDDGFDGWKRIVAAIVIAATAIGTLWLTGSMEHTTGVTLLVLVPLGLTLRK